VRAHYVLGAICPRVLSGMTLGARGHDAHRDAATVERESESARTLLASLRATLQPQRTLHRCRPSILQPWPPSTLQPWPPSTLESWPSSTLGTAAA